MNRVEKLQDFSGHFKVDGCYRYVSCEVDLLDNVTFFIIVKFLDIDCQSSLQEPKANIKVGAASHRKIVKDLFLPCRLYHIVIVPYYRIFNKVLFVFLRSQQHPAIITCLLQNDLCSFLSYMELGTFILGIHHNSKGIRHEQCNCVSHNLPISNVVTVEHTQIFRHFVKCHLGTLPRGSVVLAINIEDLAVFGTTCR